MIVSALLLSAAGIAAAPTGVRGRRSFAWRNPLSPTAESVHRKVREKIAEKIKIACRVWTLLCLAAHGRAFAGDATGSARQAVSSPDGRLELAFESDARGMRWSLARDGRTLVRPSRLGVLFAAANPSEEGSERLAEMKIAAVTRGSSDTTWKTTLSRRGTIRDRHNEMTVELVEAEPRGARVELGSAHAEKTPRRLGLVFRAYDEGVAFRYAFPRQEAFDGFVLKDEQTEWTFGEGTSAWVAPYETGVAGSPPEGQFAGEYVRLALAALDPGRFCWAARARRSRACVAGALRGGPFQLGGAVLSCGGEREVGAQGFAGETAAQPCRVGKHLGHRRHAGAEPLARDACRR